MNMRKTQGKNPLTTTLELKNMILWCFEGVKEPDASIKVDTINLISTPATNYFVQDHWRRDQPRLQKAGPSKPTRQLFPT